MPNFVAVDEDALYGVLSRMNKHEIVPEIACVTAFGGAFLATLREPYAELTFIHPDEDGVEHCCNCLDHVVRGCVHAGWKPTYPVTVLVVEVDDEGRVVA